MSISWPKAVTRLKSLLNPLLSTRGARLYAASILVAATGHGLWLPFSILYFHFVVGLPLSLIGIGLTGAGICGLLIMPIVGHLVDYFGARLIFIVSFAVVSAGSFVYLIAHSFVLFFCGAMLISSAYALNSPASAAFIAEMFPPADRDWWFGFNRSATNLSLSIGVLLAGWLASIGGIAAYHWLLLGSALGYLLTGLLLLAIPVKSSPLSTGGEAKGSLGSFTVLRDLPFLAFMATQSVLFLSYEVLEVALPPFLVGSLHAPAWGFSLLFILNVVMVVVLQVPLMHLLTRFRRTRSIAAGGFSYACSYLLFAGAVFLPQALQVPYLVLCMLLYTLAEMFFSPSSSGLGLALAPSQSRGRYMAALSLCRMLASILAPVAFTSLLALNPTIFWLCLFALTAAAALAVLLLERLLPPHTLQALKQQRL